MFQVVYSGIYLVLVAQETLQSLSFLVTDK